MAPTTTSDDSDLKASLLPPSPPAGAGDGDERMGVDEMLEKYCGEFGPWQWRHFTLVSFAWALDALHTMVTIFADREPAWRCTAAGGCDGASVCALPPGTWEWVGGRRSSTVTEWELVCGQSYKKGLVQSAFFAGCMVGCGVFGHLSDTFLGRKGSLVVGCIVNTVLGCLTAVSPNYTVYLALRVVTGLCTGPMGTTAFILATEPVGTRHRAATGMSVFYFFSLGVVILTALACAFHSWRALYIASSMPTLAFTILVLPFVAESPRWYLIRRKPYKAMQVMRAIAATNRRHLPENTALVLDNDKSKIEQEEEASGSIVDVIRSPVTRVRLVVAIVVSFFCSIVYYGMTLNVVNLRTNLYLSVVINSVCEMPSFTIVTLLLSKTGRRQLAVATMWFSGAFCVAGSLMGGDDQRMQVGRMVCGVFGIFAIAATYNLLLVYTAELFPTSVRNAALGCVQQAEQVGAVVAPMIVVLGGGLPLAVFGGCALVGGVLSFSLPETRDHTLYDTMAGMEDGEKKKKAREGSL